MTTTFFLPSSGTPPLGSLAVNTNWELTNGLVRLPCFTTKINSALTTSARTWPATSTQQWCWFQFQSDILSAAYNWTTADTVSMVIGKCGEPSALTADTHLAYVVRVVSGDGTSIRGVIGLYHATSTEFPDVASAATRIHSARTGGATNFSSQIGDRIIIEIGVHGVTPAAVQVQMRVGDPSATGDFALTAGLTTDLCPWVRLSQTVTFGRSVSADAGNYGITGTAANTLKSSLVTATAGNYSLNGQASSLLKSGLISAEIGSYSINGIVANLLLSRLINAEAGSIILTGQDATLTKTTAGYILTCDAGSFELTGQGSSLLISRLISANVGDYVIDGQLCTLLKSSVLQAGSNDYIINGNEINLLLSRILDAPGGDYSINGTEASLLIHRLINAEVGDIIVIGEDIDLIKTGTGYTLICEGGAFNMTIYPLEYESAWYSLSQEKKIYTQRKEYIAPYRKYLKAGIVIDRLDNPDRRRYRKT